MTSASISCVGFCVFVMVADHIGGESSWLYLVTSGNRFFTSAAEGFSLISIPFHAHQHHEGARRRARRRVGGHRDARRMRLRATATTTVHSADFGMERPSVALVLSVQDDIRLTVKIRAEQA